MDSISLRAMAKINLGLDVLRKREDGYHDVRMIMQTIELFDTITIKKIDKKTIKLQTNLPYLPTNKNNLIYRAAALLIDEFHITSGVDITLTKRIPVAAGLAGGSTDAAATLLGLNQLFHLNLSIKDLMERGVTLGADIPFCLLGNTALSEGIGEILTPLPSMPSCHILIAKPDIGVSTKYVYEHLMLNDQTKHPDIDGMIASLKANDLNGIVTRLDNVLEQVTIKRYPIIQQIKQTMLQAGALNALMSGSGPTVFGIFSSHEAALKAADDMKASSLAKDIIVTTCYNH